MELGVFEVAADVVRHLTPAALGPVRTRHHTYGVKVWFGDGPAGREHYEAQVVGARDVPGARTLAVEIGFHAEHSTLGDNETVMARMMAAERRWRAGLGPEAEAAPFLGRAAGRWRRLSETWLDPDLSEPGSAFAIGARLVDYVVALEPLRLGIDGAKTGRKR